MADVTLSEGSNNVLYWLLNGAGDRAGVDALFKALSGDIQLEVDVVDATPDPTAAVWEQTMTVKLVTADGEVHSWYNGPVTLAIGDTSSAGTAAILPAAGAHNMVAGELEVVVSGDAQAWLNSETVTLTASIAAQHSGDTAILGYVVANHTGVITFTT